MLRKNSEYLPGLLQLGYGEWGRKGGVPWDDHVSPSLEVQGDGLLSVLLDGGHPHVLPLAVELAEVDLVVVELPDRHHGLLEPLCC